MTPSWALTRFQIFVLSIANIQLFEAINAFSFHTSFLLRSTSNHLRSKPSNFPHAINSFFRKREKCQLFLTAQEEDFGPTNTNDDGKNTNWSSASEVSSKRDEMQSVESKGVISDLDARVLQSILQDKKLDLQTEQNLKDLLRRSAESKTHDYSKKIESNDSNDSKYSSTIFQTFEDSEFWNSFRAKSDEILESAKIFIANRVEKDSKILASLGIFVFRRAFRDVGNALPSAGQSGAKMAETMRKAMFQLGNETSFVKYVPKDNFILGPSKYDTDIQPDFYTELNTPLDEIKRVTDDIRDILSGKSVSTSSKNNRGLKSVAPSGSMRNTERQRRAYERRKETDLKREKEGIDAKIGRVMGSMTDAAWEIKREMQVEGNTPGYRSETARKQIEGVAAAAMLAGKQFPNIFISEGKDIKQLVSKENEDLVPIVITIDDIEKERYRLASSLRRCLNNPEDTWLTEEVIGSKDTEDNEEEMKINDDFVREIITTMILVRDDIEADLLADSTRINADTITEEDNIAELQNMKQMVRSISSLARSSVGPTAADDLEGELLGKSEGDISLLENLDDVLLTRQEILDSIENIKKKKFKKNQLVQNDMLESESPMKALSNIYVVDAEVSEFPTVSNVYDASLVSDLMTDQSFQDSQQAINSETKPLVEIVTEADFDEFAFEAKAVSQELEDLSSVDEKEQLFVVIILRTIDVIFFIIEKTLTVILPGILQTYVSVSTKVNETNRKGLGKEGWDVLDNANKGIKRY